MITKTRAEIRKIVKRSTIEKYALRHLNSVLRMLGKRSHLRKDCQMEDFELAVTSCVFARDFVEDAVDKIDVEDAYKAVLGILNTHNNQPMFKAPLSDALCMAANALSSASGAWRMGHPEIGGVRCANVRESRSGYRSSTTNP